MNTFIHWQAERTLIESTQPMVLMSGLRNLAMSPDFLMQQNLCQLKFNYKVWQVKLHKSNIKYYYVANHKNKISSAHSKRPINHLNKLYMEFSLYSL